MNRAHPAAAPFPLADFRGLDRQRQDFSDRLRAEGFSAFVTVEREPQGALDAH